MKALRAELERRFGVLDSEPELVDLAAEGGRGGHPGRRRAGGCASGDPRPAEHLGLPTSVCQTRRDDPQGA